jgi:hypothetical protein
MTITEWAIPFVRANEAERTSGLTLRQATTAPVSLRTATAAYSAMGAPPSSAGGAQVAVAYLLPLATVRSRTAPDGVAAAAVALAVAVTGALLKLAPLSVNGSTVTLTALSFGTPARETWRMSPATEAAPTSAAPSTA